MQTQKACRNIVVLLLFFSSSRIAFGSECNVTPPLSELEALSYTTDQYPSCPTSNGDEYSTMWKGSYLETPYSKSLCDNCPSQCGGDGPKCDRRCEGSGRHEGVDIVKVGGAGVVGMPVVAVADGRIVRVDTKSHKCQFDGTCNLCGKNSPYGKHIMLRHDVQTPDGKVIYYSIYAHLDSINSEILKHGSVVSKWGSGGECSFGKPQLGGRCDVWVRCGDVIGFVGNTGCTSGDETQGYHLHYQMDYGTEYRGTCINQGCTDGLAYCCSYASDMACDPDMPNSCDSFDHAPVGKTLCGPANKPPAQNDDCIARYTRNPVRALIDFDEDGVTAAEGDCDDTNATVSPNAQEDCSDGIDNNCDGLIDTDDPQCYPGTLDQASDTSLTTGCMGSFSQDVGKGTLVQSFIPSKNTIKAVSLRLSVQYPGAETFLTLKIHQDSAMGSVLAEVQKRIWSPPDATPTYWRTFLFDAPISVVPGHYYFIEVSGQGRGFKWSAISSSLGTCDYTRGSAMINGELQAFDFLFRTYLQQ